MTQDLDTLIADLTKLPGLTPEALRLITLAQEAQRTGTMPDLSTLTPPSSPVP